MERSVFTRLSPELRNHIYAFTFTSSYAVTLEDGKIQHALTKTCRQIRLESTGMYYTATTFNAHLEDGPVDPLINWLRNIGRTSCLLVREIHVWDMHNHMLTLYSPAAMASLMERWPKYMNRFLLDRRQCADKSSRLDLEPVGLEVLHNALLEMRIGLDQVCEGPSAGSVSRHSWYALKDQA